MGFAAGPVTLGVDLAKSRDYTAPAASVRTGADYAIPFLRRLPHGLTYRQIAQTVAQAALRIPLPDGQPLRLIADATGAGAPVVEMIGEALADAPVQIIGATFTDGDVLRWGPGIALVGKLRLVRTLQGLLDTGHLHMPPGAQSGAVRQEFRAYARKIEESGHVQLGALKSGEHDDLVTALMLSVLEEGPEIKPEQAWLRSWERGIVSSRTERERRQNRPPHGAPWKGRI